MGQVTNFKTAARENIRRAREVLSSLVPIRSSEGGPMGLSDGVMSGCLLRLERLGHFVWKVLLL
jgi:hypothetical protein